MIQPLARTYSGFGAVLCALACVLGLSTPAGAETVTRLAGRPVPLGACFHDRPLFVCQSWVKDLKEGDEVIFSDGHVIRLGEFLNDGGSARIFALHDNPKIAVRIPRVRDRQDFYFMESWLTGWNQMSDMGVPVLKVIDPWNRSLEYQLVERLKIEFTFHDLLDARRAWGGFPETFHGHSWAKIFSALKTFARRSYRMAQTGEGLQMAFDGTKWKMFDFGEFNHGFQDPGLSRADRRETVWGPGGSDDPVFAELENIALKKRADDCAALLEMKARL